MFSMFRHSLLFPLLMLWGAGCSSPENPSTVPVSETADKQEDATLSPPVSRRALPETLELSQYRFDFDTVPESEFREVALPLIVPDRCDFDCDCYEALADSLVQASNYLDKLDSCYLVQLTAGDQVAYCSQPNAEEDLREYLLRSVYPEINYVGFEVMHWEYYEYQFINLRNGREFTVWGNQSLQSPDKKRFLVTSADLDPGFVENGIQLWRVGRESLVLELEMELDEWEPQQAVWVDAHTIYLKRHFPPLRAEDPEAFSDYLKITITDR